MRAETQSALLKVARLPDDARTALIHQIGDGTDFRIKEALRSVRSEPETDSHAIRTRVLGAALKLDVQDQKWLITQLHSALKK